MSRVTLGVVVPAGPRDDVLDTVRSVLRYTTEDRLVVVVDDTHDPAVAPALHELDPTVTVLPAPAYRPGTYGGLFLKLCHGYRYLASRATPDVVLRLDADALVIGERPEADAVAEFAKNPAVGLLGSYRVKCTGELREFSWGRRHVLREASVAGLTNPRLRRTMRGWLSAATATGYEPGESTLGGAYIHSGAAFAALVSGGYLERAETEASRLGEDHLFALATAAAGYRLGDFALPGQPMGLSWKGLPQSPADLVADGRKIVHSVRSWDRMDESAIRTWFAERRAERSTHGALR